MTKEEKFVVSPLIRWFERQKAAWRLCKPQYGTAATGWDIQARRKNQDILVEAKYINGPFLASFTGLVTAPLANRPQCFKARKYRGWSYGVCWAIGSSYTQRNVYQLLLDYFIRNLPFWKHYIQGLQMKYVFFVENGQVAKISFGKIIRLAVQYKRLAKGEKLNERRIIADKLIGKSLHFS